jgi:hypothetical protein
MITTNGIGAYIENIVEINFLQPTPTQSCLAIFDPRLLTGTSEGPDDWTPPTTPVNYTITFGFSGSGTASPQ